MKLSITNHWTSWTILCLSGLLLSFSSLQAEEKDSGMVWSLKGEKNTVYLAGSIHLLRSSDYPLPGTYEKVFSDSEVLVLEVSQEDMANPQVMADMMKAAQCPPGKTTYDYLSEETVALMKTQLGDGLTGYKMYEVFQPWFMSLAIVLTELTKAGVTPDHGVESYFTKKAAERGVPIESLESVSEQLAIFTGLTDSEQDLFLRATLQDLGKIEEEFEKMIKLWREGKAEELAAFMNESMDEHPELKNKLLKNRNINWVKQLKEDYLKRDKNIMLLVGGGHLPGTDGVIDLLQQDGITAEQVE